MTDSALTIEPVAGPAPRVEDASGTNTFLIGPDTEFGQSVASLLAVHGITVQTFASAAALPVPVTPGKLERLSVILDLDDSSPDPLGLIQHLQECLPRVPIIVLVPSAGARWRRLLAQTAVTVVLEKALAAAYVRHRLHQTRGTDLPSAAPDNPGLMTTRQISFRQMTPDDADREQAFVRSLSASSRLSRFFSGIRELSPQLLERFTHVSYPQSSAIIATAEENGQQAIIGVARYQLIDETGTAEFALVVADRWQRSGLGGQLPAGLIAIAAIAGLGQVVGFVQRENTAMPRLTASLGFARSASPEGPSIVRITRTLR